MTSRIEHGVSIPQTFPGRPVDPGFIRKYLAQAEALGFHSAWVVEQIVGAFSSLEPNELLTYAAIVSTRMRLGHAAHRDARPRAHGQEPHDPRSPARGAAHGRRGAGRPARTLSGLRPQSRASRHLRGRVLQTQQPAPRAQARAEAAPAAVGRRPPSRCAQARGRAGRRVHGRGLALDGQVRGRGQAPARAPVRGQAGAGGFPDHQALLHRRGSRQGAGGQAADRVARRILRAAAGAGMLMLNPVFDEMEHLDLFASEIASQL